MTEKTIDHRLAWLAGIIDGEGWISFRLQRLRTGALNVKWQIGVGNTDAAMMDEVASILNAIGVRHKYYLRQPRLGDPRVVARKAQGTIDCERREDCRRLLTALLPYLITKGARAATMLQALDHRIAMQNYRSPGYVRAQDDAAFVAMMTSMTRMNGRKKGGAL